MNEEKVSIVVPMYNVESTIRRCIESILTQSYSNYELILVNDGSTDKTLKICEEYFLENDNKIIILNQPNLGVSSARNRGLEKATGKYILFVDSDDYIGANYINEILKWKEFDLVTCGFNWQDKDLKWNQRFFCEENTTIEFVKMNPSIYLGKYYFGSPWAKLFKTEIIKQNNLYFDTNISNGEDILFIFKYLDNINSIKIVPICDYFYCFYLDSLVRKKHKKYIEWQIQIEEKINSFFTPRKNIEVEFLYNRQFYVLRNLLNNCENKLCNAQSYNIFINPFFKNAINFKLKNGDKDDKILIFFIKIKKYSYYKLFYKIKGRLLRK